MNLEKMYYYLFYKLYKFWETISTPKFWSDWKASLSVDILGLFFVSSIFIYYKVFVNKYIHLDDSDLPIAIIVILVSVVNYFIFHHKDRWKEIVHDFDKWPKEKNKKGGIIVWSIIFAIIANLLFAFYLMSQVDWSPYR